MSHHRRLGKLRKSSFSLSVAAALLFLFTSQAAFSASAVIVDKESNPDGKYVGTSLSITKLEIGTLNGNNRAVGFGTYQVPVEGSKVLSVSDQSFTQEVEGVKVAGVWVEDTSFNWRGDINVNLSGFSKKQISGISMKQGNGGEAAISSEITGNVVVNIDSKDGDLKGVDHPPEIMGLEFRSENSAPAATYTLKGDVSSTVKAVSPEFNPPDPRDGNNFFAALSLEQEDSGLLTVNLGEAGSTINLSTSVKGTGAKDEYVFGAEVVGQLNMTGSNVTISSENTGKGMSWALGIGGEGAKININADNLVIQSKTNGGGQAIGIASFIISEEDDVHWVPSPNLPDLINITATQTTITASAPNSTAESDAIGIRSPNHTTININGNLNINASISGGQKGVAIQANDGSKININPEGNSLVNIFGDIQYNSNSNGDDETIEKSSIALNLGSNGTWEGNFYLVGNENNSSMTLNLKQGATWTPTNPEGLPYFSGVSKVAAYASIASLDEENDFLLPVKLTLDGGTVDASTLTGKNTQVQVASLSGSGGTFVTNVSKENGKYEATNSLVIETVDETAGKPNLTTTTNSVQSGELSSEEAVQVLNALASTVKAPEGQLDKTVLVTDQAGGPDVLAKVPENGDPITTNDIVYQNNSVFDALETAVALGTSQWRAQIGSLFKRLGEVRDDEGNIGAWVRVYQNRVKWNGEHNDTFTVQLGADYKFNNQFIAGGAFNYSDGNTKLNGVKGDNHAWGFAMYGTWLGPDGIYVDLEGKYNRLDNKITSRGNTAYMHGKYKGNAWSLSAQAGWTLPLSEMFFVEPQAQLSWGQAGSDTFSTGTYNVKQKAFNVVEGRLGAKAGVKFPEKRGQAYAKASVVYDWASKFKGSLATNGVESKFNEDLGGCAGEFAVGGQFNMTKNAHVYADVTTRVGGKLKEPFQWTVGLRYSF